MKRKAVFVGVVLCLAAPTLAATSLGWWDEGAPGSTHQSWDFTAGYVKASGAGYTADPESTNNPNPNGVVATLSPVLGGTIAWVNGALITGNPGIFVALEIPNYEALNLYKEVWVDIGNATFAGVTVSAHDGGSVTFEYEILPGQGDAEFGVKIWPNPEYEKINFYVTAPTGGAAVLDYIHVDTICIPEPVTIAILGLGGLFLRKRIA